MTTITIGNRLVGDGQPCFIIAEIGINHNGCMETAKRLISLAKAAGCDAVKFQKRTVEKVYTPDELSKPRDSVFGKTNGDLKRGLEFGLEQYKEIDKFCKNSEIMWFASCWDTESIDFIDKFNPPCYKVASASLTDKDLLLYTKSKGKPILLSTGMSSIEEIDAALEILEGTEVILYHCTSTYPCENSEINLAVIPALKEKYNIPVGYSGHEKGVMPSVSSVILGACSVERHITLDRTIWGSDQAASLESKGLMLMVRDIRNVPHVLGNGIKVVYESEVPIKEKLRKVETILN